MDITADIAEVRVSNYRVRALCTLPGQFYCSIEDLLHITVKPRPGIYEGWRVEFYGDLILPNYSPFKSRREYFDICITTHDRTRYHVGRVECRVSLLRQFTIGDAVAVRITGEKDVIDFYEQSFIESGRKPTLIFYDDGSDDGSMEAFSNMVQRRLKNT
jgi:hypothetical protein